MFHQSKQLFSTHCETPLGTMLAISDEDALYLLQFADNPSLNKKIARLTTALNATVTPGAISILNSIKHELNEYFAGTLTTFTTPLAFHGTSFSRTVWHELNSIPYQKTCAYATIATAIGRPTASRAVARANAANPLAIIIPCHRVIASNGSISGYNGGTDRKAWLLQHESRPR